MKASELAPGMLLHGALSTAPVHSVSTARTEVTYNLIVADFHTYFIGERRLLSHDNTVRRPTAGSVPGLAK